MGHSVSKGRRAAQNDSLVRDVTYLREQISKHEKAYEELQLEHEQLKDKVNKQDQEFEKVKEENMHLKKALSLASVTMESEVVSQGNSKIPSKLN
jgi:cell shape-determining protein MreC